VQKFINQFQNMAQSNRNKLNGDTSTSEFYGIENVDDLKLVIESSVKDTAVFLLPTIDRSTTHKPLLKSLSKGTNRYHIFKLTNLDTLECKLTAEDNEWVQQTFTFKIIRSDGKWQRRKQITFAEWDHKEYNSEEDLDYSCSSTSSLESSEGECNSEYSDNLEALLQSAPLYADGASRNNKKRNRCLTVKGAEYQIQQQKQAKRKLNQNI